MTRRLASAFLLTFALFVVTAPAGCGKRKMPTGDTGPLPVEVATPVDKKVVDFFDFTGRLDSINSVDVRPRVTGYIIDTPFKEGDIVTEKDVLFRIDDRQYKSKLQDAEATVDLNKARLKKAKADNSFAKETAQTPGAISKADLAKYQAAEEESDASLKASLASRDIAKLNVDWCTVTSPTPIKGRVSRYLLTKGNIVNADATLLTTIVAEDPIYAYADVDERSLLRVRRGIQSGRIKVRNANEIEVFLALADEKGYPHKGWMNFINNRVDPLTGTMTIRASFDNPEVKHGRRLMEPGMFVRLRIPLGEPQEAVLVIERALVTDQGLKNVFVVDGQNKVQYRRVELGALQPDGLRVILAGLKGDEKVLLTGLQMVRPGMEVNPKTVPMPVEGQATEPPADKENGKAEKK